MIVSGYKHGAKTIDATEAICKHVGENLSTAKKMVESVLDGNPVKLPDDFVLREDLESAGFIVE